MNKLILSARGWGGQVDVYEKKIVITRKWFMWFMQHGLKWEKSISLKSITAVQFKSANMLTNGYIQFSLMWWGEAKGGLFQATKDENTVMFNLNQQEVFEEIRDAIEEAIY